MAADDPKPTPGWIDLQAVLTEELACIQEGRPPPPDPQNPPEVRIKSDAQTRWEANSEAESADRAGDSPSGKPSGKFFKDRFHVELWGLCLSGGGIRSATFALGLLQGLAEVRLLPRFHYLSTVSGGGYIGSWLSSWASRHERGIDGVVDDLNMWPEGKKIEADPLWYLRSYTSYLTPQLGLLSADTWTLVATYLRNLLLNWLVLVPLFWVVVLTPKIGLALVRLLRSDWVTGLLFDHRWWAALTAGAVGSLGLVVGMTYIFAALVQKLSGQKVKAAEEKAPAKRRIRSAFAAVVHRLSGRKLDAAEKSASAKGRTQGKFLLCCLTPVMLAALLLPLGWAWYPDYKSADRQTWLLWAVIAGVVLRFVAWAASFCIAQRRRRGVPEPAQWMTVVGTALASLATGALGGLLVWWILTTLFPGIAGAVGDAPVGSTAGALDIAIYVCFAPPLLLLAMLATEAVFIGLISRPTNDEDREWWGRAGGWLLIACLFWMGLRVLALFGPLSIHWLEAQAPVIVTTLGGVSGIITAALGFGAGSPGTPGKRAPKTLGGLLRGSALTLAATVFVCTLFAGLALAGDWILHYISSGGADTGLICTDTMMVNWLFNCGRPAAMLQQSAGLGLILKAIAALLCLAIVMQIFVSINRFSLHAMYRARLIRAYLGASNPKRHPNWFTGFDQADNLVMADIGAGDTLRSGANADGPPRYPFHILNTALNLVHGENLAWQQRKAASLTISPLHVGNRDQGYRRSETYGHRKGISLGTALTISGAAASPNMGYHSSPIIGLVMTLFNVRLGAWLGNPRRRAGDRTFDSEGPRLSAKWLLYEALGLTDNKRSYVYLTDGGHFENLGLYELVQRRCRLIVVSDAGCDPDFEFADLGNAIRKIRVDLGIEITMDKIDMHPRAAVDDHGVEAIEPGHYFATGTIRYPEWQGDKSRDGKLVYIKPGIYGSEPRDVMNYAATHPDFPHESTADQWFDESQYESYRRLGRHVAYCLLKDLNKDASIDAIIAAADPTRQPLVQAKASAIRPAGSTSRTEEAASPTTVTKIHRRPPKRWFGGAR
jgi:hypothetical protein